MRSLYKGLPPALVRQFLKAGLQMSLFKEFKDLICADPHRATFTEQLAASMSAAAVGQVLANPADVLKVRLMADGRRVLMGKRPKYSGAMHAAQRIWVEEGYRGFYKGTVPAVQRSALSSGESAARAPIPLLFSRPRSRIRTPVITDLCLPPSPLSRLRAGRVRAHQAVLHQSAGPLRPAGQHGHLRAHLLAQRDGLDAHQRAQRHHQDQTHESGMRHAFCECSSSLLLFLVCLFFRTGVLLTLAYFLFPSPAGSRGAPVHGFRGLPDKGRAQRGPARALQGHCPQLHARCALADCLLRHVRGRLKAGHGHYAVT